MIEIYYGEPSADRTERRFLDRLERDLRALEGDAVVLANFTVGPKSLQIDAVVAVEGAAFVVEIKGYQHAVRGKAHGQWVQTLDDGSRRGLGARNPIMQASEARFAVVDALRALTGVETKSGLGALVCLHPSAPPGSEVPVGDYKAWVGGYERLFPLLKDALSQPIPLADWRRLADHLGLVAKGSRELEAESGSAAYRRRYHELGLATQPPCTSPVLKIGDQALSLDDLIGRLVAGENLQMIGGSGAGKTVALQQVGMAATDMGFAVIPIAPRFFDGDFASLLRRGIAPATPLSLPELMKAIDRDGAPVLLLADGLNECPPHRRSELIAGLQGARLRFDAQVIVTDQKTVSLPSSLAGDRVSLPQPDLAQARAIVETILGRSLDESETGALDVVSTANDAAVLADVIRSPEAVDGRYALYAAFTRRRMGPVADRAGTRRALADLASYLRSAFVGQIARPVVGRRLTHLSPKLQNPDEVEAQLFQSGLLVAEGEAVRFRHDLFRDFFAAERLLALHDDPTELAIETRRPINLELAEFVLGGCLDARERDAFLEEADADLLRACLRGVCGTKARDTVLAKVRDMMARIAARYERARFSLPEGQSAPERFVGLDVSMPAGNPMRNDEVVLLSVLPVAVRDGLLPEILAMIRKVTSALRAEAARLEAAHPTVRLRWEPAVLEEVYGFPRQADLLEFHHLLQSTKMTLFDRRSNDDLFPVFLGAVEHPDQLDPGEMCFLFECLMAFDDFATPPPGSFVALLGRAWRSRVHMLQALATDLAFRFGDRLDDAAKDRLSEELGSWFNDGNPILHSAIFDALSAIEALEVEMEVEDALAMFEDALSQPWGGGGADAALTLYTSMHEHPYASVYVEAFEERLSPMQRQEIRARAFGEVKPYSMTRGFLAADLFRDPTQAAVGDLRIAAEEPVADAMSVQDSVSVYVHAVGALAKLGQDLPMAESHVPSPREAWRRIGELIYAITRGDSPSDLKVVWSGVEALGAELVLDPIRRLISESSYMIQADIDLKPRFKDGLLRLCREALEPDYAPQLFFTRGRSMEKERLVHRRFALEFLGQAGAQSDLGLARAWLNDPKLGAIALGAARKIEAGPSPS